MVGRKRIFIVSTKFFTIFKIMYSITIKNKRGYATLLLLRLIEQLFFIPVSSALCLIFMVAMNKQKSLYVVSRLHFLVLLNTFILVHTYFSCGDSQV